MKKADITKQYIKKYPDAPNRTLARKLREDYPTLYSSIESARDSVRMHNGSHGVQARKDMADKSTFKPKALEKYLEEINTPVDFDYHHDPYKIRGVKKLGIINDVHIPLHDKEAMKVCYRYLKNANIDGLLINGDFFDFYWLAIFAKDYKHFTFKDELQMCREELDRIRQIFGGIPMYFKEGNHEERWVKNLRTNAEVLYDLSEFQLETLCHADELKLKWVKDKRLIEYGKLNIAHGHEFKAGIIAPVNIARTYYLKANANICLGHHHTTQEYTHKDINGLIRGCWAIGGLLNLNPKYHPYNNWNHGFALVETEGNGNFEFQNKKIIGTKIK